MVYLFIRRRVTGRWLLAILLALVLFRVSLPFRAVADPTSSPGTAPSITAESDDSFQGPKERLIEQDIAKTYDEIRKRIAHPHS